MTMSSIAHINTLPDLCLQIILQKLSLSEQLHNRIICAHWNGVLERAFRSRKVLTLHLIDFSYDEDDYEDDEERPNSDIQHSEFHLPFCRELRTALGTATTTTECCYMLDHDNFGSLTLSMSNFDENPGDYAKVGPFLVRLFPGIRSLTVTYYHINVLDLNDLLYFLLPHWGTKLGSLSVRGSFGPSYLFPIIQKDVIDALNDCAVQGYLRGLKHLTLEFDDAFSDAPLPLENCDTRLDLPILGQLETFRFTSYDNLDLLYDSLVKYAVGNANLVRIDAPLQIYCTDIAKYAQLGDGQFRAKMKQLRCMYEFAAPNGLDRGAVGRLTRAFSSLTSFEVHILEDMTLGQLLRNLLPLNQLIYLKLYLVGLYDPKDERWHERSKTESTDPDKYDFVIPPQFPTVKVFSIRFSAGDHTHLAGWNLHLCFPMVEAIEVEFGNYTCRPCRYNYIDDSDPEHYTEDYSVECVRKMMRPIKRDWVNLKVGVVRIVEPEEVVYKIEDLLDGRINA